VSGRRDTAEVDESTAAARRKQAEDRS